ncbi:MAG: cupin domain-containing protein [Terracidiphilus sp.]
MSATALKMERKNFSAPAEVRPFDKGKVEVLHVGEHTVVRATFEPGWKWSTCIAPIAKTRSCEAAHFGYQLSGKMIVRMDDGAEMTTAAGDVVLIPPGHDSWVVGNEPAVFIDFQGMAEYAKRL